MPTRSTALTGALNDSCAISRSLGVLVDPWSFLLLREAMLGRPTFSEFRSALGISASVLSAHLATLVDHGILEKTPYQQPGQRTRSGYSLTPAGHDLKLVVVALQQWGEQHLPHPTPPTVTATTGDQRRHVRVTFTADHQEVDADKVAFTTQ